jgi:hypothetical protein
MRGMLKNVTLYFYVRYGASYRDLDEIMAERGVSVDHATLNRWVVRYSPLIADEAKKRKPLLQHAATLSPPWFGSIAHSCAALTHVDLLIACQKPQ